MSENADKGLLPAGLFDVLAPDAAFEASVLERLLADFAAHGFDRVAPPLASPTINTSAPGWPNRPSA